MLTQKYKKNNHFLLKVVISIIVCIDLFENHLTVVIICYVLIYFLSLVHLVIR